MYIAIPRAATRKPIQRDIAQNTTDKLQCNTSKKKKK